MKKLIPSIFTSVMLMSCSQLSHENNHELSSQQTLNNTKLNDTTLTTNSSPKNIIMMVGDGMGPAYISAYRYFHNNPATDAIEQTVFDRHLVGSSSTYPAKVSGYVTDSAASATALATATKSYNGAIGVDVDKNPVESVLVWAKKQGKKTGMVVTSQINHATPASYLVHNEQRYHYNAIADSFLAAHNNIDLLMGGGWRYFIREDANLVAEFQAKGFNYIDNYSQLSQLPHGEKVLGLFADKGLPWALDDSDKHRLSTMVKAAIPQLENQAGFFMLVEASQIDWGGHANDIATAMAEMDDLAKTVEYLESYVKNHPDTLVVLTADHSTGGFTIGKDGNYQWQPSVLRTMTMSPSAIAKNLAENPITIAHVNNLLNFNVTKDELTRLKATKAKAQQALATFNKQVNSNNQKAPSIESALYTSINHIIDQRTVTGWTTSGHTGVDVPVFAMGKGKDLFKGLNDNTDIAKKLFWLLGKQ